MRPTAPAMPKGITYMNTMRKTPKMAQRAALEISWAQLGTNWMKNAPKTSPEIDASPPMTLPIRSVIERNTLNESGATKAMTESETAAATHVYAALTPKTSDAESAPLC